MTAKRRRSKAEIKEAERQETLKKNEITNKVLEMNMMRQRMEELEEKIDGQSEDVALFQSLFKQGYLSTNDNGEVNVVSNQ